MTPKPIEIAPRGVRWPWYPLYIGEVTVGAMQPGEPGTVTVPLTVTTPLRKGRVGFRRWARHLVRKETA